MKIEKISYGKSFENQAGLWEKVGIEATLEEGETPEKALSEAKQIVESWHQNSNPHLYPVSHQPPASDPPIFPDPEFEELKKKLGYIEYREDAIDLINNNGFRLNVELNKIANSKPTK